MKSKIFKILLLVLFSLTVSAAVSETKEWSSKMASFINPVIKIYSVNLNQETFTPEERNTLLSAIKELRQNSHGLKYSFISFFSKKDPVIEAEFKQFKNNLDFAEKTMAFSTKQSTTYIKGAIGQCASCHSNGGKSTHLFELFKNTKMSATDKGQLALAVRDYEASTGIYKSILLDKTLQDNYFAMNDILVSYLNSAILSGYDNSKIISDLLLFQKSTTNKGTLNDLKNVMLDIKSSSEINTFEQAMMKFGSYSKEVSNIEKSIFTSLRIKNLLHAKLKNLTSLEKKAESYEALGDIYSYFPEISIFMVPENYYELCIQTVPKTETAKKCFDKYQSKITLGYSGSMGSNVPEFEKVKIQTLKKQSGL